MANEGLLIQRIDGSDTAVHDTEEWGIKVTSLDIPLFSEYKDLESNDWAEYDGLDEYLPATPSLKEATITVGFVYKWKKSTASAGIRRFIDFITGGKLRIYDISKGIGKTDVRFQSYSADGYDYSDANQDIMTFSIDFVINDMRTAITLNKNSGISYGGKL